MGFDTTLFGKSSEIFKQSTTKLHMLGTRRVLPDGRVYRYAKNGAVNLSIGRVLGAAAHVTTLDSDVVVMEARTTAQWDAGDHTIRIHTTGSATSTALNIVANQFAEGYIWVNDEAGEGQLLQVKEHAAETATGSTGGLDITCYDEDILGLALTTASQVGLYKNLYDSVVIHTGTTGAGAAVGVAPRAVTASRYFWAQTWGPCPVLVGTAIAVIGDRVGVLNTTGGSTMVEAAGTVYPIGSTNVFDTPGKSLSTPSVGYTLQVATATTEQSLVFLTIAP